MKIELAYTDCSPAAPGCELPDKCNDYLKWKAAHIYDTLTWDMQIINMSIILITIHWISFRNTIFYLKTKFILKYITCISNINKGKIQKHVIFT